MMARMPSSDLRASMAVVRGVSVFWITLQKWLISRRSGCAGLTPRRSTCVGYCQPSLAGVGIKDVLHLREHQHALSTEKVVAVGGLVVKVRVLPGRGRRFVGPDPGAQSETKIVASASPCKRIAMLIVSSTSRPRVWLLVSA